MKTIAKFNVTKVSEMGDYNGKRLEIQKPMTHTKEGLPLNSGTWYETTGIPVREITLSAVFDNGIDAENASFAKATPTGTITFQLNNPALADEFKPGDVYYVTFSKTRD